MKYLDTAPKLKQMEEIPNGLSKVCGSKATTERMNKESMVWKKILENTSDEEL